MSGEYVRLQKGYPAFPWSPDGPNQRDFKGLSIRDYFASAALTGILANSRRAENLSSMEVEQFAKFTATLAYNMADAMIARVNDDE